MKKLLSLSILALFISFSSFALGPISGPHGVCIGNVIALSDSTDPGGVWSSSNIAIATVGSSTGYVTGVSAGVVTITYTLGTFVTYSVTVDAAPAAITGPTSHCMGTTITKADVTPGGTWSSSAPSIESIDPLTGVATGVSAGTAFIYYTVGGGCYAITMDTVTSTALVDSILGPYSVCVGSTVTLTNAISGGTWTSGTPAIATINPSTGVVTGVSAGYDMITYTVTTGCGSATTYRGITVNSTTSPGTIVGATSVAIGATTTLSDGVGGGSWTSSNTAIATIGISTGIVTGVAAGSCTITYTVTGCSGTAYTTAPMTVTVVNRISGHVLFAGPTIDSGTCKVWLIHYDPSSHLLTAVDSVSLSGGAPSLYYQFLGAASDSFRVKAAYFPTTFTGTGYIPTYHTNQFYWHDATVILHSGTADDNKDINMAYGTVTAGPGFIAGDVTTGANKGTAGGAPAVGLLMYLRNASGTVIQQAYTDATGHYSFGSLPLGNYDVYPEAINYSTIPYPTISLTSTTPSVTNAGFVQHTVTYRITPVTAGIHNVSTSVSNVVAYPNPTTGKLNVQWNVVASENGTVTISDITGREIYSNNVNFTQGTGSFQVDLSSLNNGLYMISVKSATINYNNKIQVQH